MLIIARSPEPINLGEWIVRAYRCRCADPEPAMCAARRGGADGKRCGCVCHEEKGKADER